MADMAGELSKQFLAVSVSMQYPIGKFDKSAY
jgi:hypothetical protein